ncbi:MAG: hypothetical protein KDJ75_10235 [Alphaproteobacteria bacterium]|nr:hypothetical protein [Alphaproteobacteria bacterium]
MKLFISALFIAAALLSGLPAPSHAAEGKIVQCGEPLKGEGIGTVETDPGQDYCNIYERQLAYREERLKYKADLEERRENYHAPRREAYKNYKADLEALNETRQDN